MHESVSLWYIRNWGMKGYDRLTGTPQWSVGPKFELSCWSYFPSSHFLMSCGVHSRTLNEHIIESCGALLHFLSCNKEWYSFLLSMHENTVVVALVMS